MHTETRLLILASLQTKLKKTKSTKKLMNAIQRLLIYSCIRLNVSLLPIYISDMVGDLSKLLNVLILTIS